MHFLHPKILYFLFLLIIPILIHLFQLQRFEKVEFTNVQLLKKIEQQTRKSSKLKKFLILLSRLLMLASIIIAFAQPYLPSKNTTEKRATYIYLDNSYSMQAKDGHGELLEVAKTNLIENLNPIEDKITLITNNHVWKNLSYEEVKKEIIKINYTTKIKNLKSILLQLSPNKLPKNLFFISDFQSNNTKINELAIDSANQYHFIQTVPITAKDIRIDSMWVENIDQNNLKLYFNVNGTGAKSENFALFLFIDEDLAGKSTISFSKKETKTIDFSIPITDAFEGYLEIEDPYLTYNNRFYFVKNESEKTNIMIVGKTSNFLKKIYTSSEFNLSQVTEKNINIKELFKQNLLIINEIDKFSKSFIQIVKNYLNQGGKVVIISSATINISSYQNLFTALKLGKIEDLENQNKHISKINYKHPFFKNVFHKPSKNFAYPYVKKSYSTNLLNSSNLLEFEDASNFISEITFPKGKLYWIASSLEENNTNFTSSPLIVPVFYNFSLENNQPKTWYYRLYAQNNIFIHYPDQNQEIVHLKNNGEDFIPLQVKKANGFALKLYEQPEQNGIYQVLLKGESLQKIAFNHHKKESDLTYQPVKKVSETHNNIFYYNDVKKAFQHFYETNKKNNLWQLFIIFALIFLGTEVLLQKFLKN